MGKLSVLFDLTGTLVENRLICWRIAKTIFLMSSGSSEKNEWKTKWCRISSWKFEIVTKIGILKSPMT